jgi:hypothetical protein
MGALPQALAAWEVPPQDPEGLGEGGERGSGGGAPVR